MPGQTEQLAKHFGITLERLQEDFLRENWSFADPNLRVPSPRTEHGTCVFYDGEHCSIHAHKPYECRVIWHKYRDSRKVRLQIIEAWRLKAAA